jgi:hypothetical protein
MPSDEVDHIRRSAQTPVSLEKPVGDDDESEFGHFLADETAPLPDELAETALQREALHTILGALSERERRVLELRYGLDGQQPRTLDEVGRAFNVTGAFARSSTGTKSCARWPTPNVRDVWHRRPPVTSRAAGRRTQCWATGDDARRAVCRLAAWPYYSYCPARLAPASRRRPAASGCVADALSAL